jgi:hypothetical protein
MFIKDNTKGSLVSRNDYVLLDKVILEYMQDKELCERFSKAIRVFFYQWPQKYRTAFSRQWSLDPVW